MKQLKKWIVCSVAAIMVLSNFFMPAAVFANEKIKVEIQPQEKAQSDTKNESEKPAEDRQAADLKDLPSLIITEVNAGTGKYDFVEVYNISDKPVNLDYYTFSYRVNGEGLNVTLPKTTISPGKSKVIWFTNNEEKENFNSYYKSSLNSEDIAANKQIPGLNSKTDFSIVLKDSKGKALLFANYKKNASNLHYAYPPEGIEMNQLADGNEPSPTPGTAEQNQVPEKLQSKRENKQPTIDYKPISEWKRSNDLSIEANVADDHKDTSVYFYYQADSESEWKKEKMEAVNTGSDYKFVLSKSEWQEGYFTYYIEAVDENARTVTEKHQINLKAEETKEIQNTGKEEKKDHELVKKDKNIDDTQTVKKASSNTNPYLLLTEIAPNSKGGGTDYYEYFELYNNSNQPLKLNKYAFVYRYTDSGAETALQVPDETIDPGETLVFWFNNGGKTLNDFNQQFGTSLTNEQVYEFTGFSGFANGGNRAVAIKDNQGNELSSAAYLNGESDNSGKVIQYSYPKQGTEMNKQKVFANPSPGVIQSEQVPEVPVDLPEQVDDTEAPNITHQPINESEAFAPLTIEAEITDNMAAPSATLYYKKLSETEFTALTMTPGESSSFTAEIPGIQLESDIVYYIEASDGTIVSKTNEFQVTIKAPNVDYQKLPLMLVTEVTPDTANVNGADGYEFIEIYNNTNQDINFKDYKLRYRYGTDPGSDVIWESVPDDVVISAGKTLVFWIINGQNADKTVADFNANYGTNLVENKDIVKVFSGGMANSGARGLVITTNTKTEISVGYYNDTTNDDTQPDKGIVYKYPVDGSTQSIKASAGKESATPGRIEPYQVPKQPVMVESDTEKPSVENLTKITKVNQKENIELVAEAKDNKELKTVNLFYKTDGEEDYKKATLSQDYNDTFYHHILYSPEIIGKTYVDYYFVVSDGTNQTESGNYRIAVTNDLDHSSLRMNVKDGDILSGQSIIKGTSKEEPEKNVQLFIDGKQSEETYSAVENEAYLAFEVSGINTWFQNGVTMGDEILHIFDDWIAQWETITVPIEADRLKTGDNTLTIRAGNKASPFDLESEENRDDYNLRNVRLILADGTMIYDLKHSDPEKVLDMGDDGTNRPFENFTFSVTEEMANSKAMKWDTTKAADGKHTVSVKDANEEITSTIDVDNTAPSIHPNVKNNQEFKGKFTIDAEIQDEIAGVAETTALLDGEKITLPYDTASSQLSPGSHKLVLSAKDNVGNAAEQVIHFSVVNENPEKPELIGPSNNSEEIIDGNPKLKVKASDPMNDDLDVTFYKGFKYDAKQKRNVEIYQHSADTEPPNSQAPNGETKLSDNKRSLVSELDGEYLTTDSTTQFPYHRFDVAVDKEVDENDKVEVVWQGKSLESRKVTMYAWNHTADKWDIVDVKIAGAEDFSLKGTVAVKDFVANGKVNVLVQDEIPSTPDEYDYTFVWMSDTQYYSDSYPYIYDRQTNWIADMQEKMKIKYVFHTGDIVDNSLDEPQWINADRSMKVLDDAKIPYGVLAGNHDVDQKTLDYTEYYKYFGQDRFKDKPYYGESYKNNRGHYDLISEGGNDYIMIYMGWGIDDEGIKWMNEVLKAYPDRKAFLNFHEYLLASGTRHPLGEKLYNEVVLPNENVVAVLSGHYHESQMLVDEIDDNQDGTPDRKVYQILADYQAGPEGGEGYIRLLHFDQDNNRIIVNTYSPYKDKYNYYDREIYPGKDEFTIDLDLTPKEKRVATDYFAVNVFTDSEIGKVENVKSGEVAEMEWTGLKEGAGYYWYATAEDDYTGEATSDIWTFTKGKNNNPDPDDGNDGGNNPDPSDGSNNSGNTPNPSDGSNNDGNNPDPSDGNSGGGNTPDPLDGNDNGGNNGEGGSDTSSLPSTATANYQFLLFGMILIIFGAAILSYRKRKQVS
ncbi:MULTISPECIES: lamin tail domain-containing protein [Bacillus]|uniref:LPXTG-motif cell wall-anchored protein n=1 Tax=Bacillus capparidis TaxID=1840411 RepID=A0ABS4D2Y7_9BACI|nr:MULTISPECIES: lamin tail domain-containing protein [Bacillus]MBP1083977.1 LPXTG-motif cell wall-anchored protein [Bacillus capparidis]MED1096977.1 lamin tail domain-containing protein [Bacillus capparidis]